VLIQQTKGQLYSKHEQRQIKHARNKVICIIYTILIQRQPFGGGGDAGCGGGDEEDDEGYITQYGIASDLLHIHVQRPHHSSSGWSLASHRGGPGSNPVLVKWDL
jgi:hypothetical protein